MRHIAKEKLARQRFTGGRIRQARNDLGLTQLELARRLGYTSEKTISDIERGINSVDPHVLMRLAHVAGVDIAFFVDPGYYPRVAPRPNNRFEWEALYPDDIGRARIHWEIDQRLNGHKEAS